VADEHTFTLAFEASGEVTPAPHPDTAEPDTDATEPEPEEAEEEAH
jgi:hypothetical protein